jgi:hypothetical protein
MPTHGAPMPIDAYSPCPGGTGKKIKFCCKDLLGDLQKIERMVEAEQYMACLSYVERLEQSNPDRACLLATKTLLLRLTGRIDEARLAAAAFLDKHPGNPLALCDVALLTATKEGGKAALPILEKAIVASESAFSGRLYEAINVVVQVLLSEGHFLAARALTLFQASVLGHKDPSVELLMRLNAAQGVSLVVKDGRGLQQCPDDVPWKAEFDEAFRLASVARFSEAERKLAALSDAAGQSPTVWRNLAKIRSWMADNSGAIDALRRYAALDINRDDAVEAEALALFLAEDPLGDQIETFDVIYPITDPGKLQARFGASYQVAEAPVDPRTLEQEGSPPPKSVYLFFDKPVPKSGEPLDLKTIPRVVCHALFYGKETDRAARLECVDLAESDRPLIGELVREAGGEVGEEKVDVSGRISRTRDMLNREWRLSDGATREEFQKLADAYLEDVLLRSWPEMPLGLLDGKTPREAAHDGAARRRVLAAILVIDFWLEQSGARFDTNRLRSELGLPTLDTIDASETPIAALPLVRLARVDAAKLADDELLTGYRRAVSFGAQAAVERFGREMIARETLAGREERLQAYRLLSRMTDDPDEALQMIESGRQAALQAGGSCADWDLWELPMRFERMEVEEIDRLIDHIHGRHGTEPGILQRLAHLLMQMGVLRPDGTLAFQPSSAVRSGSPIAVPGGEAEDSGRLWTPDGVAGGGGEKPKLWTPGMD